jgi:uncharacterized protein
MTLADTGTTRTNRPAAAAAPRALVAREVGVFLATTAVLLSVTTSIGLAQDVDVSRIDEAGPVGQAAMFGQAFIPLLAALAARASVPRHQRRGWGIRRTSRRSLAIAWAFGLAASLPAAGLLWATGLAAFDADGLGPIVPLGLTVLVLPYVVLALAEDVGWRGLLVERLAEVAGPRTVVLVSGVAWSMFHWPLMLFLGGTPDDVSPGFALASYTIGATALGAVLANMQLRWGIWPGVLAHAVVNATLYHVVAPLTDEHGSNGHLVGEVGIVGGVVTVLLALAWWRVAPLARNSSGGTSATGRG